jgi:hypothetical protein
MSQIDRLSIMQEVANEKNRILMGRILQMLQNTQYTLDVTGPRSFRVIFAPEIGITIATEPYVCGNTISGNSPSTWYHSWVIWFDGTEVNEEDNYSDPFRTNYCGEIDLTNADLMICSIVTKIRAIVESETYKKLSNDQDGLISSQIKKELRNITLNAKNPSRDGSAASVTYVASSESVALSE